MPIKLFLFFHSLVTNDDDIDDVDDFDSPQKNGQSSGQSQTFTMDVDNEKDNKDISKPFLSISNICCKSRLKIPLNM